jgi:hypothetical protein
VGKAFGWQVPDVPGVFVNKFSGSLRMEINGDEPETFQVLSGVAPVLKGVHYRLRWKADASGLSSQRDPGFAFQVVPDRVALSGSTQGLSDASIHCGPLLTGAEGECDFVSPADTQKLRISLGYTRAQGTTRVSGVLQLLSVHLEPGS